MPIVNGDYREFIATKRREAPACGITPPALSDKLFPFQRDITRWALRRGRAAIWADCGLGKSWMALSWANALVPEVGRVLILTPLAVAEQFVDEGRKLGIAVEHCRDGHAGDGIVVTNYERIHKFDTDAFPAVVLDESSCLKDYTSRTRNELIERFEMHPYRLACTATPSPNDHMELGNHSEFLGLMTRSEMLATYFVHDGGETQKWRIKRHARGDFWRWVASWAVTLRKPSDLGYDDAGYDLPPLEIRQHVVPTDSEDVARNMGVLFLSEARGLREQQTARRLSIDARVEVAAEIANGTDRPVIVWCDLNAESAKATAAIPDAVEVKGSDSIESKEAAVTAFRTGETRVLVTKPSICGWGVNWQHCSDVVFLGVSNSFEAWYQAIRRVWRFGQDRPVRCHVVISDAEGAVVSNLERKREQFDELAAGMIANTHDLNTAHVHGQGEVTVGYEAGEKMIGPDGEYRGANVAEQEHQDRAHLYRGDCVETMRGLADESIHYTVFSPPFASLYTYTDSDRDMGNCKDHGEFHEHFGYLVPELLRVTKPGRLLSFHCMNLPTSKARDGIIGITDFRGDLIRVFVEAGWIYHSEVCIWKDPVTAMQRTKALGLLHKQLKKDSTMSRQGIPDYLVTMRKPGTNDEPVSHTNQSFPVEEWQQYASPIWTDINPSDTLQREGAREHDDERHIAPLQLEVIRRALRMWSNADDVVLSPFMGIGSEGYVAVEEGRRFVGVELKESYYRHAVQNIASAQRQLSLSI